METKGERVGDSEPKAFVPDLWLAEDPGLPVFGLNLACLYPLPTESGYASLAHELSELDPGLYLYPPETTHVTLMTLVNFALHRCPSAALVRELTELSSEIVGCLSPLFSAGEIPAFHLRLDKLMLSGKAAILSWSNPTGEIELLRCRAQALLRQRPALWNSLQARGLNVPGIIHSTILRFRAVPQHGPAFRVAFEALARRVEPVSVCVSEILLTDETKPYMRCGQVLHRYGLAK